MRPAVVLASQLREAEAAAVQQKGKPRTVSGAIVPQEVAADKPRHFPRKRCGHGRQRRGVR